MADNKLNQEQLYALLQYAARKLGTTPVAMAEALHNGGVDNLAEQLSPANAEKLRSMLNDRSRVQQLLQSPQAQALMQKLLQK